MLKNQTKVRSFEYMNALVKYLNACIRLVIPYRPPPSELNGLKENDFFDEFNSLLECLANTSSKLLITGDFNFHVNKQSETHAKKFLCMLNGFNLEQHVSEATYKNGNTLDLLITSSGDNFISDVRIVPGLINPTLFDHYAIHSQVKQRKQEPHLTKSTSNEQLVNEFAAFFHEKISKMRCSLCHDSESIINPLTLSCCQSELTDFCTVNANDIRKYLVSSGVKTCALDPLPSILLRECLDTLLPVITRIVNLSLTTGNVPRHFKEAMVRPKLKNDSLDHQQFSHFRPISNLKLLSKVTEKAVACQLTDYLNAKWT